MDDSYSEKVRIVKTSRRGFHYGPKAITGTAAAVPLSADSVPLSKGVVIKNPAVNTASIFVGAAGVTDGTGFEIEPGEKEFVDCDDLADVFIFSNASLTVTFLGN